MPTVEQVIKDPEFYDLPYEERRKVLIQIDPYFSALDSSEQDKAISGLEQQFGSKQVAPQQVEIPLKQAHSPELMPSHEPVLKPPESTFDRTMKGAVRTLEPITRPLLEGGGLVAGGTLGTLGGIETGPGAILTGILGAGAGYSAGKGLQDTLDIYSGAKQPYQNVGEAALQTAKDVGEGALMEGGGRLVGAALAPAKVAGKWVFKKIGEIGAGAGLGGAAGYAAGGPKEAVEGAALGAAAGAGLKYAPKALANRAGKVLMAAVDDGGSAIYARNTKEANAIEKIINKAAPEGGPKFKFSLAQKSDNPATIMLERTQTHGGSDTAARLYKERIAENNAALRNYYEKNFPGEYGVDDLIDSIQGSQSAIKQSAEMAKQKAVDTAYKIKSASPTETGETIISELESAQAPIKSAMNELEKAVPDYPMDFKNTLANIKDVLDSKKLSISQRKAVELATKNIETLFEQGKSTHTAFAVRRTLNDQISKAFKNGNDSIGAVLLKVKSGIDSDLADVAALARTGKIAEYQGRAINPDEIAQSIEMNMKEIAKSKGIEKPDVNAMAKELNERGVPSMRQYKETDESYASRIGKDYERITQKPVPTTENQAEIGRIKTLTERNEELKKILAEVSPGQDVAASMKAYNDFASSEYFGRFDKGAVKSVLQKGSEATGKRIPVDQIPRYFKTETGANDLIKAIGEEKASGLMKGQYAYDMLKNVTDQSGMVDSKKLFSWVAKNESMLKKYGISQDFNSVLGAQKIADQAVKASAEFESAAVKNLLGADPEKAIAAAMAGNKTGKAAAELLGKVKGDKAATEGLKKALADHIITMSETTAKDIRGGDLLSYSKFVNNKKKYMPAIKEIYKDDPKKIKALMAMQKAYEIMMRTSKSPIGGGSDTKELAATALGKIMGISHRAPGVKILYDFFKSQGDKKVNEIVSEALFYPEYAETLMTAFRRDMTPKTFNKAMNGKVIDLAKYRQSGIARAASVMGVGANEYNESTNQK